MGDAVLGNAGREGDDAGDVGSVGGRGDVAKHDLVHPMGAKSGALQQRPRGVPAQFLGGDPGQRTKGLGEGSAGPLDDGYIEHHSTIVILRKAAKARDGGTA